MTSALLPLLLVLAVDSELPPGVIRISTEPPGRPIHSVDIRTVGSTNPPISLPVRQGLVRFPSDMPMPYEVAANGFEPAIYDGKATGDRKLLVLRALGSLKGVVKGWQPNTGKLFWLCYRAPEAEPEKTPLRLEADGAFEIPMRAGIYHGAVWSEPAASRVRVGVVVRPADRTNLGALELEKTGSVRFRILDAATLRAVPGAVAGWDPPEGLNSEISKALFRTLWSAQAGPDGLAAISGVSPVRLRWRVQAKGYVSVTTPVAEPRAASVTMLPDVRLKRGSRLTVNLEIPSAFPKGAIQLQIASPDPRNSLHFVSGESKTFRGIPLIFDNVSPGPKRLSVYVGKTLILYQDAEIRDSDATISVAPRRIVIYGTVSRKGQPATGYIVRVSDPHDARAKVAEVTTDSDGAYRIETFQRGRLFMYARGPSTVGTHSGTADKSVEATEETNELEADFEMPASGIRLSIRDEDSGAGIPNVLVKARMDYADGSAGLTSVTSNASGELSLDDLPPGEAILSVSAKGYQSKTIKASLARDATDLTIPLKQSASASGMVLGPEGQSVARATLSGGYTDPLSVAAFYLAETDATGTFHFDSPPDVHSPLYVTAPGYALGITFIHPGDDNVITLTTLNSLRVFVFTDTGQPVRNFRLVAAPAGGPLIPAGALDDLAEANGMPQRTLLATGGDGASILPSFLNTGTYDFYLTLRSEGRYTYQKVGTLRVPFSGDEILTFHPPKEK